MNEEYLNQNLNLCNIAIYKLLKNKSRKKIAITEQDLKDYQDGKIPCLTIRTDAEKREYVIFEDKK